MKLAFYILLLVYYYISVFTAGIHFDHITFSFGPESHNGFYLARIFFLPVLSFIFVCTTPIVLSFLLSSGIKSKFQDETSGVK